jgi:hypothetical protein
VWVNNADLAVFTQDQYRRTLSDAKSDGRKGTTGSVINASWIDEQVIVSDAEAATKMWDAALSVSVEKELRVLLLDGLILVQGFVDLFGSNEILDHSRSSQSAGHPRAG